jgi:hypothetical protein
LQSWRWLTLALAVAALLLAVVPGSHAAQTLALTPSVEHPASSSVYGNLALDGQDEPSIAASGDDGYLAVWTDYPEDSNGISQIYATHVSPDGTVVEDTAFAIAQARSTSASRWWPTTARRSSSPGESPTRAGITRSTPRR